MFRALLHTLQPFSADAAASRNPLLQQLLEVNHLPLTAPRCLFVRDAACAAAATVEMDIPKPQMPIRMN